jgi:tetratricopeptide (TPR) repeat protein
MIKGGRQKLDEARSPGAGSPFRGGRPKTRQLLPGLAKGRTAGKYGITSLVVLALCGTLSLGVVGCSALFSLFGWQGAGSGEIAANVRLSPEEINRLTRNVYYYKLMGQPELGLKELEQVHQQNPDNLKIINILAQNYEELGKFATARQLYEEALARHGPQPVLANNLCFTYYLEGRWQEAETCFRKTLAQDPQNIAARNNLGLLYCRLGRQEEARRLWREVQSQAAADHMVSQALATLGRSGGAVYAQRPAAAPAATRETAAPRPVKVQPPVEPVTPQASGNLARQPAAPAKVKAPAPAAAPKESAAQVVQKPAAPSPVAAKPRQEAEKPAAVPEKAEAVGQVRPEGTAYTHKPAAAPAATQVTAAPKPEPIFAGLPAPAPAKVKAPAPAAAPKESAAQVVQKPAAPSPVAAKPRQEAEKPAALLEKAAAAKAAAVAPEPAPVVTAARQTGPNYLTCAELVGTAIEVRNGTWTHYLAHMTRASLWQEGYTVAKIGNHIDFGVTKTIIYYRPGVERVARELHRTFFPKAKLTQSTKLKHGMDIKILLGADLQKQPQVMARLVSEGQ